MDIRNTDMLPMYYSGGYHFVQLTVLQYEALNFPAIMWILEVIWNCRALLPQLKKPVLKKGGINARSLIN
ncbi:MAG: hypothetical protein QM763_11585 [Agriterribacter sp.]